MKFYVLWNSEAQNMKYAESCSGEKKKLDTLENMHFPPLFLIIHRVTDKKKIGYIWNNSNWWGLAKVTITPGFFQLFTGEDGQTVTQVHILYAWSFVPMEFDYIAESEMYLKFT